MRKLAAHQLPEDLLGQKFGLLTCVEFTPRERTAWRCACECGGEAVVMSCHLKSGHTLSCGCVQKERTSRARRTHGQSGKSPEYEAWEKMKNRCSNPNYRAFHRYGGRGISVSPIWADDFQAFFDELGPRTGPGYSLDRIDNNRGYEPGNCRWATQSEQCQNRG